MLLTVGHFQLDGAKLLTIQASAVLADCYEAFGAIFGLLSVSYIAFECSDIEPLEDAKFQSRYAFAVSVLLLTVIADRIAQSSTQLYLVRALTGMIEGACFIGSIIRLARLH